MKCTMNYYSKFYGKMKNLTSKKRQKKDSINLGAGGGSSSKKLEG
jgi:hypothetical protein